MRKPKTELTPEEIEALLKKRPQPDLIVQERSYKLITPLFSGGVEAGKPDPVTPVRGTEIRGHLRFWWRATRGGQFANLDEMRAEEGKIWGSASTPSMVIVNITDTQAGTPMVVKDSVRGQQREVNIGDPGQLYGYVAFPLRGDENTPPGRVYENASFTLRLDFPKQFQDDIKAALWAWETFGGIGARTRRGFGALQCIDCQQITADGVKRSAANDWLWSYQPEKAVEMIRNHIQTLVSEGKFHNDIPHLSRNPNSFKVTGAQNNALAPWRALIQSLKEFRQSRAGQRGFGRSHWPEPDAIRHLTGQSLKRKNHDVPVHSERIDKFPRAVFGLPIIFEFKQGDSHPTDPDRDPRKTELKGANHDRLASPLIIRPLACKDGKYVGLALVLEGPRVPPGGLKLAGSPRNPGPGSERLTPSEAKEIKKLHRRYNGNTDILQAFLDTL